MDDSKPGGLSIFPVDPGGLSIFPVDPAYSDPEAIRMLQDALALVRRRDALQVTVTINYVDEDGPKDRVRRWYRTWPKW